MKQYIDKSVVVAEIKRYKHKVDERLKIKNRALSDDMKDLALQNLCGNLLHFINTLEVKEIHEDIDLDLNPFFEEFEIDPDSRFAPMVKEGFYKSVDRYLNKKEGKV